MKTFLRVAFAVVVLTVLTNVGFGQSCSQLPALTQNFETGFGSWAVTNNNFACYPGGTEIQNCNYTWDGGFENWGWSNCTWCICSKNSSFSAGSQSAYSDLGCAPSGHKEQVLTSPQVNFQGFCDPSLPPPTMTFAYAYFPSAIQSAYGTPELSIEVTTDITQATPSWIVIQQYTDLGPLATGPALGDFGGFELYDGYQGCNWGSSYYGGLQRAEQNMGLPGAGNWKQLTLSLPSTVTTSSKAAVRFRVFNDGGASGSCWFPFYVDDITVNGPYNKDIAMATIGTFVNGAGQSVKDSAVISPTTTFQPTASVRQVGNVALGATNATVRYQIYPLNHPVAPLLYDQAMQLGTTLVTQCTQTVSLNFPSMSPTVTQIAGEYTCRSIVTAAGGWDCNSANDTLTADLVVGYDYDVKPLHLITPSNVRQADIVSIPQTPSVLIRNIGLNAVTGFHIRLDIMDPANQIVGGGTSIEQNTLNSGAIDTIYFPSFTPAINGLFRFRVITLLGSDLNKLNDTLIETRQFYWKYDVKADSILVNLNALSGLPEVPQGTPYRPVGRFENNGASFLAEIPIVFKAYKMSGTNMTPPTSTAGLVLEDSARDTMPELNIADGMRKIAFFAGPGSNKLWTPQQTGLYYLRMYSDLPSSSPEADGDPTNDTVSLVVSSIPRLLGVYQVGFGQDIATMQAALDSLNYRGVRGNVIFQLTDNNYSFTTDFAFAQVRYSDPVAARVTFMPAPNVFPTITLSGGSRIVMDFNSSNVGFDGSNSTTGTPNRALTIIQGQPGTAAFFLSRGASNDLIQNCNIQAGTILGQTTTKTNQRSIGIFVKNQYPNYPNDTLACSGNVVNNNDIEGFRTAIWEQGLAPVFVAGSGKYTYHWDSNNVVKYNIIRNCGRAGIFGINQYKMKVYNNDVSALINNSTNVCGTTMDEDANVIGIGLGGVHTACNLPFDNSGTNATLMDYAKGYVIESQVFNNKIHDINSANMASAATPTRAVGIEVIQDTVYGNVKGAPSSANTPGIHPIITHNVVYNNMIWSLNANTTNNVQNTTNGEAVGILFDARNYNDPTIPTPNGYFTQKDSVINNTIWITGSSLSRAVCLDLSRMQNGMVWNNILVNDAVGNNVTRSLITYTVQSPDLNLNADHNLYWFGALGNAGNTMIRLQILDANGNYREQKTYTTLEQWQSGSLQDVHSIFADPKFRSTATPIDLHISTFADNVWSPAHQQGGFLNTSVVTSDIDGEVRGVGGLAYDIGADEFPGKSYANDLYALRITSPISTGGVQLVSNPITISTIVQNVGTSSQLQKRIYLTLTQVSGVGNGTTWHDTIRTDFKLNETKSLTFTNPRRLVNNIQTPFVAVNGTTYKFFVNVDPDNNPVNDTVSTTVTFFVQKNAIVVSYNSSTVNGSKDRDSVLKALNRWGFLFDQIDRSLVTRPEDITYAAWPTLIYCVEGGTATKPASVGGGSYTYALSYDERQQLMKFLNMGIPGTRRSLIIAGMDVASIHDVSADQTLRDTMLTRSYLHEQYVNPPNTTAYVGTITGVRIEPGIVEQISSSPDYSVDGLQPLFSKTGTAEYAYYYNTHNNISNADTAAGITYWGQQNIVNYNIVSYGFDWRHLSRLTTDTTTGIARVMLNSLTFIEKNGGCIVPCTVPVELLSFDAKLVNHDVAVSWESATELNINQFNVERKLSDGSSWAVIANGSLPAKGVNGGGAQYKVLDPGIPAGSYDYRLAYIHNDGHVEYSTTRQVVVPAAYALFQNYPNPFNPTTQIDYVTLDQGQVKLSLFDVVGNLSRVLVNDMQDAGSHTFTLDASTLSSGIYYYRLEVNGFTQTKRLMLLK